jgi:MoaA/NifB/PqqE/SkfB family radical SAM enzyme/Tfp pilus assembly protein PilF
MARDQGEGTGLTDLLELGKQYLRKKDYACAFNKFKEIIERHPTNDEAHFELGKIYLLQEKYDLAREALLRARELNPASLFTHLLLAKAYKHSGQKENAIEEFKKVIDLGYKEENIAKELSDIYRELGDYESSINFLRKALDYGYNLERFNKDLDQLYWEGIRSLQNYNFRGEYYKAIEGADKISDLILKDNLMLQNIVHNEKEIAQKKITLRSRVRSLTFTLTNRCNLNCLMCNTRKISWELPLRAKREIIKLLPHLERIMWQGGEAFLYEDFEELLDTAARFPIRQALATNGLLIDQRIAEKLVRYNVELTFSIDGVTKEVYEHIRPGADFEKVLEKVNLINYLRQKNNSKMKTRLNVLIMRANYHQIEDFVEFAKKYKFDTLFFNSVGCDFKGSRENVFYHYRDPDILAFINEISERVTKKAEELGVRLENWLPSVKFFVESENRASAGYRTRVGDEGPAKLFCHAPWQRLYIDCGGWVRPDCLCLPQRPVGNLSDNSIEGLWNCQEIKEYRKRIVERAHQDLCNPDCIFGRVPERNLKYV